MIPKNHSLKAVTPSVIIFIWGAKEQVEGITKMALVISTDTIFVQNALYGVREGNKTDFVKIC